MLDMSNALGDETSTFVGENLISKLYRIIKESSYPIGRGVSMQRNNYAFSSEITRFLCTCLEPCKMCVSGKLVPRVGSNLSIPRSKPKLAS